MIRVPCKASFHCFAEQHHFTHLITLVRAECVTWLFNERWTVFCALTFIQLFRVELPDVRTGALQDICRNVILAQTGQAQAHQGVNRREPDRVGCRWQGVDMVWAQQVDERAVFEEWAGERFCKEGVIKNALPAALMKRTTWHSGCAATVPPCEAITIGKVGFSGR